MLTYDDLLKLPVGTKIRICGEHSAMIVDVHPDLIEYEVMDESKYSWPLTRDTFSVISLPTVQPFIDEAYRRYGSHHPEYEAWRMVKLAQGFSNKQSGIAYLEYSIANARMIGHADVEILQKAIENNLVF